MLRRATCSPCGSRPSHKACIRRCISRIPPAVTSPHTTAATAARWASRTTPSPRRALITYGWTGSNRSRYALRLDLSRNGPQLENEGNDSQVSPNQINLNFSAGLEQGRVAGALPGADVAGDFYRLGMFNPGNAISATILYPTGALLNASQTVLSVQLEGNPTPLAIITNSTLNFTVTSNGVHYVRVESLNRNLRAQYLLTLNVADTIAPQIVTTSLPAAGTTTTAIVDRFTLGFSEDLLNTTVSNVTNYELRSAGPNGTFGDADDLLYHVTLAAPYSVGLVANYLILDGPLQPGAIPAYGRHRPARPCLQPSGCAVRA